MDPWYILKELSWSGGILFVFCFGVKKFIDYVVQQDETEVDKFERELDAMCGRGE